MGKEIENISYDEAVARTEQLLEELENQQMPVDKMLEKSREVVALISHCKKEISKVSTEVDAILKSLREEQSTPND